MVLSNEDKILIKSLYLKFVFEALSLTQRASLMCICGVKSHAAWLQLLLYSDSAVLAFDICITQKPQQIHVQTSYATASLPS